MSSSFSGIDRPLASLYDLKLGKFHLVIYQYVTIHCHPSMVHAIDPKALYFLVVQKNQSFFLKKQKNGENPRINIMVDWLNIKRLHCCHSKIVKWLNQTKHTLWGSPQRDLHKIGWGLMSYHIFQKETINLCFPQK